MDTNAHGMTRPNGQGSHNPLNDGVDHYVAPLADVYETPDAYMLLVDMPGAAKDAISLSVYKGNLVVRADVRPHTTGDATMLCREIGVPGYYRVFRIGDGIDLQTISAQSDQGVLTVKLLKSPAAKPREILIT